MAKKKKDGIFVNFYMERVLVENLNKFCEETGLTKTKAIEIMVKEYLDKNFKTEV